MDVDVIRKMSSAELEKLIESKHVQLQNARSTKQAIALITELHYMEVDFYLRPSVRKTLTVH